MNLQFAFQDNRLYLLEVNPRASRTVPFLHKAAGAPWARFAARVMAGRRLKDLGLPRPDPRGRAWVKAPVFPFSRFGIDPVLGPEMRSTGEVLGSGPTPGLALAKALRAAGTRLSENPRVFVSLNERDKGRRHATELARGLCDLALPVLATQGTAAFLSSHGVAASVLDKLGEGGADAITALRRHNVGLVLNTPRGGRGRTDAAKIRLAAVLHGVPCITTIEGANAAIEGIRALRVGGLDVRAL
jgi:carbamoyl-phosphate synthase large subunit